ncbi:hypothetical protein AAU61_01070 [Desulfocarbo indianensis]|nr:hypothetical protein AAU61_01070 [Desulfocarbo indianensis]
MALRSKGTARIHFDGLAVLESPESGARVEIELWMGSGPHFFILDSSSEGTTVFLKRAGSEQWRLLDETMLRPIAKPVSPGQALITMNRLTEARIPLAAFLIAGLVIVLLRVWFPGFGLHGSFALAAVTLIVLAWLSTGTLAPHAATLHNAKEVAPCKYLVNVDHPHWIAVYKMLEGANKGEWAFSMVLRRVLQPLLSLPFTRVLGYLGGGFVLNLALSLGALFSWGWFLNREFGNTASRWGMWLLATYPGLHYFIGLPYAYALIAPTMVWGFIFLHEMDKPASWRKLFVLSLLLGCLMLGYDLIPFFAPALLAVVWHANRRFTKLSASFVGLLLPTIIWSCILYGVFEAPVITRNTSVYPAILASWLGPYDWGEWGRLLAQVPLVAVHNLFVGTFITLPALLVLLLITNRGSTRVRLSFASLAFGASVILVFFFNNLGPPYQAQYVMRGYWMARLYQPVFIFIIFFAAQRISATRETMPWNRGLHRAVLLITILVNTMVVLGPATWPGLAEPIYGYFCNYPNPSPPGTLTRQLELYGRRPLGFCP